MHLVVVEQAEPGGVVERSRAAVSTEDDVVQLDLFSTLARQRKLEVAIDGLAERFGTTVVYRADDLNKAPGTRLAPTLDFLDDRTRD